MAMKYECDGCGTSELLKEEGNMPAKWVRIDVTTTIAAGQHQAGFHLCPKCDRRFLRMLPDKWTREKDPQP